MKMSLSFLLLAVSQRFSKVTQAEISSILLDGQKMADFWDGFVNKTDLL
jgi:hypothetical protein